MPEPGGLPLLGRRREEELRTPEFPAYAAGRALLTLRLPKHPVYQTESEISAAPKLPENGSLRRDWRSALRRSNRFTLSSRYRVSPSVSTYRVLYLNPETQR